jgi:hypothetical protein
MVSATTTLLAASVTAASILAKQSPQPAVEQDKNELSVAKRIALIVGAILIGAAVSLAIGFALTTLTPITFVALPVLGAAVGLAVALAIISKYSGKSASEPKKAEDAKKAAEATKAADAKTSDTKTTDGPTVQSTLEQFLKDGSAPSKEKALKIIENELWKDCSPEDKTKIKAKLAELESLEGATAAAIYLADLILKAKPEHQALVCIGIVEILETIPSEFNPSIFRALINMLTHDPRAENLFAELGKKPGNNSRILAQYVVEAFRAPENYFDKSTEGNSVDEILSKIILENPNASDSELFEIAQKRKEEICKDLASQKVTPKDLSMSQNENFIRLFKKLSNWDASNVTNIIQHSIILNLPSMVKVQLLRVLARLQQDNPMRHALMVHWKLANVEFRIAEPYSVRIQPIDVDFCRLVYNELVISDQEALDKLKTAFPHFKALVDTFK